MGEYLMKEILKGAYDIHVHAAPDVVPRLMDDMELAASYQKKGMKGFLIKAHYFNTAARAYHVRNAFPGMNVQGAVVLNNSMGGLNPYAVQQGGLLGTRFVFMPTMDAENMWEFMQRTGAPLPFGATPGKTVGIRILDKNGELVESVDTILDIIKKFDMVLCTGHISPDESLALLKRGKEKGIRRMCATHVEWPAVYADVERRKMYVQCGAYIEHNVANIMSGDITIKKLVEEIHQVGTDHIILSTDLGQANNPVPADKFEEYVELLLENGITEEEMHQMIVVNPGFLMEK